VPPSDWGRRWNHGCVPQVSDCHAIGDMATTCDCSGGKPGGYKHPGHGYVKTGTEAVAAALTGGTDVNCGCYFSNWLEYALGNHTSGLNASSVDLAAGRVINALIRTGELDAEGAASPFTRIPTTVVDNAAARALAREAGQQSIVLLENRPPAATVASQTPATAAGARAADARGGEGGGKEGGRVARVAGEGGELLLPIKGVSKLAFIGPHADATQAMLSNYHGDNTLVNSHSPLMAAKQRWPTAQIVHAEGVNDTTRNDTSGFAAAVAAAKAAELAVVFVGLTPCNGWGPTPCNEGESHDRNEHLASAGQLELPGSQQALVEAIAAVQPRYVVVLINGGALGVDWIAQHSPAVVEAFYPGEMGGDAIIDVLSGDYNPTAKLPITVYPASFADTRPITDMSMTSVDGITHLHYTGKPLWTFGHGESFTTFSLRLVSDSKGRYEVEVKNTGAVEGGFNLLGFVTTQRSDRDGAGAGGHHPAAVAVAAGFPRQRLFGFVGLAQLQPGEARCVSLPAPTARQLSVADAQGHSYLYPGRYTVHLGAPPSSAPATGGGVGVATMASLRDGALEVPLVVEGTKRLLLRAPEL
jgi:beta-D-xylosidase 4